MSYNDYNRVSSGNFYIREDDDDRLILVHCNDDGKPWVAEFVINDNEYIMNIIHHRCEMCGVDDVYE